MRRPPCPTFLTLALTFLLAVRAATAGFNPGTDSEVGLSAPEPTQGFTVAILGDLTTGSDSGLAVLERAVAEINLLKPDLVIHIGDLVPGYTRDMAKWQRDIEGVKAVLTGLEPPLFPVAGNHDVITGTGMPSDRRAEDLYRQHFGPLYYSFDHRGTHFVSVYSDEALQSDPTFSPAQLQWLRDDLAATDAADIFVFTHKPVWEYAEANWESVHAILKNHPVRAVFAGHFHHYYKSGERDGIKHYVIGVTGGRTFSPEPAGGLEHYCLLRIEPDGYRLALVKPGHILADDYVSNEDFKNMEKLRSLSRGEAGVTHSVRSPELGHVNDTVSVLVTNPLDQAIQVDVRGLPPDRAWRLSPSAQTLYLEPGGRRHVYVGIRCARVPPEALSVPEIDIQYTYVDSKGRRVPILLRRRIPLAREVIAPVCRPTISLDGRAEEAIWQEAPLLTTARWRSSPYESSERGPTFRILAAGSGLYFFVESQDADISSFRGERILSDALFFGAVAAPEHYSPAGLKEVPVVIVFPFGTKESAPAIRAFWDPKTPVGTKAKGVHVVTAEPTTGAGWQCEGFVPWDLLTEEPVSPDSQLSFNVGAWDNDGELFSELFSWAPTENAIQWGKLSLQPSAAD